MLAVVYLIFNEGYAATSGELLVRENLVQGSHPARTFAGRALA